MPKLERIIGQFVGESIQMSMNYKKARLALLLAIFLLSAFPNAWAEKKGKRFEFLTGIKKTGDEKSFWDRKFNKSGYVYGKIPAKFLADNFRYIKPGGKVLDMGMGEGRNAVFLARQGYNVVGIDISSVAIKKARMLAEEFGVRISTVVASLEKYKIQRGSFDAIICFYYVDRNLHNKMMSWLKPGGVIIYESHTDKQKELKGFRNYESKYLLRESELLKLFSGMRILKYEEPLHLKEFRASAVFQKK